MSAPATSTEFLGIIKLFIDSVNLQPRLPSDKLEKMRQALKEMEGKKKVIIRQLQRVGGYTVPLFKGNQGRPHVFTT